MGFGALFSGFWEAKLGSPALLRITEGPFWVGTGLPVSLVLSVSVESAMECCMRVA